MISKDLSVSGLVDKTQDNMFRSLEFESQFGSAYISIQLEFESIFTSFGSPNANKNTQKSSLIFQKLKSAVVILCHCVMITEVKWCEMKQNNVH